MINEWNLIMSRKLQEKINSDREIVDLRMESEDIINNMDFMAEADFERESKRIADAIDARIAELYKIHSDLT